MKKKLVFAGSIALSLLFMVLYSVGCSSKAVPVASVLGTPKGFPTPGTATFPVLYNDGTFTSLPGLVVDEFAGGGSPGFPSITSSDSTIGGASGDTYGYLIQWTASEIANLGGYSGLVMTGNNVDFSSYTTCTFWAKANQSMSVGFNAAEPSGDSANVPLALTTTWTQYSLNIASGARSDGQSGVITSVANYFVVVITSSPGSTPLDVSLDKITFTGPATATPTATSGGPTNTPTATPTPYVIFDDSLHYATGESEFDGGGGASTTSNLADTSNPHSGTVNANWAFAAIGTGGYVGWNVTSPSTNLSGATNCTFWAKSSRTFAGSGIEFYGGAGADNGGNTNHEESVTTTYTQFSFALPQPLDQVTVPFGIVINNTDVTDIGGSGPLTIYVDDILYQ